jgi:hypothetical protein
MFERQQLPLRYSPDPAVPEVAQAIDKLRRSCFATNGDGHHRDDDDDDDEAPPLHLSRSFQRANDCAVLQAVYSTRYMADIERFTEAQHQTVLWLKRLCKARLSSAPERDDPNLAPVCYHYARELIVQTQFKCAAANTPVSENDAQAIHRAFANSCRMGEYTGCQSLALQVLGPMLPIISGRNTPATSNPELYAHQSRVPTFANTRQAIEQYLTRACDLDPRGCVFLARAHEFLAQDTSRSAEDNAASLASAIQAFHRACKGAADTISCQRAIDLSRSS